MCPYEDGWAFVLWFSFADSGRAWSDNFLTNPGCLCNGTWRSSVSKSTVMKMVSRERGQHQGGNVP
jgi:hypothetical protein